MEYSLQAVRNKVEMNNKDVLTTHQVSQYCKVDLSTIINWIEEGKIPAYRTPGGHRRIKKGDLIAFLKKYKMPIPEELGEKKRKKVLIVDDEEAIIDLVSRILGKFPEKYLLYTATDGFQAGQSLTDFKPDLIILDLILPGIDGFEVCKNIRRNEGTNHIKILTITGYDSPENEKKIFAAGADDYLAKPFEVKEFQEKVDKLLES